MTEIQEFFDKLRIQLRRGRVELSDKEIFSAILIGKHKFIEHEGEIWDFKESWPTALNDEYFDSLCKLICAFANNMGGLIIFNVVDEDKTFRKSSSNPNSDRFLNAVKDKLINCSQSEYRKLSDGDIECPCIVVYPKSQYEVPAKYRSKSQFKWYVRDGYERKEADSKKIPVLFCRQQVRDDKIDDNIIESSIPPSPATLPRFVSRFEIMETIFDWLHNDRQPRAFLYGRGGSGKTTIAYEVARHVSEENLVISKLNQRCFNVVIFISAKKSELNVYDGKSKRFLGTDFVDANSLYRAILICSGWYTDEDIEFKSEDELVKLLESLFDVLSIFLVIDDIDTLTTAGTDGGLETVFTIVARAKVPSKVLYTLRNAPTHALRNSIEVPGLRDTAAISAFLNLCSHQFSVPEPNEQERVSILLCTERRPLGIESVMALRRTVPNFTLAVKRFEEHTGDDAPEYVFQREWDSLASTNRSRYLLAALALRESSVSLEEMQAILKYDTDSMNECLLEVIEMFVDKFESMDGTKYSLGRMTKQFVIFRSQPMPRFEEIKERVINHRKTFHPQLPQINRLRAKAERYLFVARESNSSKDIESAWHVINDKTLSPKITEHPAFKELSADISLKMPVPRITEALEFVRDANRTGFRVSNEILGNLHRSVDNMGVGDQYCKEIVDFVNKGKQYGDEDRVEICLLEASRLYNTAKRIRLGIIPLTQV